ncbi:MAG: hypothetical protein WC517_04505 [Patescibacteria group bacterium]
MSKKPQILTKEFDYEAICLGFPPIMVFLIEPFQSTEKHKLRRNVAKDHYQQDDLTFISGRGTKSSPYSGIAAEDVTPHCGIVNLWLAFREASYQRRVFIEVNDYVLQVTPEGVIALDGTFTRLLPKNCSNANTDTADNFDR